MPVGQKNAKSYFFEISPQKSSLFFPYFKRAETCNMFEVHIFNLSILVWNMVRTGLKSTWIYMTVLKSPWKLNLPWKVLEKHSKALKSPLILPFTWGLNTDFWDLNQYKIVVPLFGAAYAASNKGTTIFAGPRSAVGNVSGYRCVSDCRSRGRKFDPGPVPYFCGDWSWNDFYSHSPPFRWFIQEGLLSVTSESMCTNYWLTACSSLPRKKCG